MEMFASTVVYEAPKKGEKPRLVIYDKTQGAPNSQLLVANMFDLLLKNVRVLSPYVGGAFGSGLRPQYQLLLASMAALSLKRSVRVSLTRDQMCYNWFQTLHGTANCPKRAKRWYAQLGVPVKLQLKHP